MKFASTVEVDLKALTVAELRSFISEAAGELLRRDTAGVDEINWSDFIKRYGTISALKKYREITGVGLRAAKDFIDSFGVAFVYTAEGTS
jgi:hypothetical protein